MTTGMGMEKCSKIRHIVRLRQMLRRWRKNAAISSIHRLIPSDVPSGHIAVVVGPTRRRFILRATFLNHPVFKNLLVQTEEEYGFANQTGPLSIPCCDEAVFEEILRFLNRSGNYNRFVNIEDFVQRGNGNNYCHVGLRSISQSTPLLEKSVW